MTPFEQRWGGHRKKIKNNEASLPYHLLHFLRQNRFYIGLYGQTWVNFVAFCWGLVIELMKLNRNKIEYYLRGRRAMELIQAVF